MVSGAAVAVSGLVLPITSAVAVTDTDPDFILIPSDLEHILAQIQISEAHAAGGPLLCASRTDTSGKCVRDPMLPHGLRTVDGSFNNLEFDKDIGAADQVFPRRLDVQWRQAEANPGGLMGPAPSPNPLTTYEQTSGTVWDSSPRTISNLIVDSTTGNPAAVDAAANRAGSTTDQATGEIFLPNEMADEALSAPVNAWFTFFGQFFDHGLDLVDKGGNGVIVVPLTEDDPLYTPPVAGQPNTNFMMLTRATNGPGPDGVLGTGDDIREHNNETTPFVDQNQTYTSHPAHQVFLREYKMVGGKPVDTGKLLNGAAGGLATWNDVKTQAREKLGIALGAPVGQQTGDYPDVVDVPQIAVDLYGNFVPNADGFPQVMTPAGGVSGTPAAPVSTANALRTGHAFLEDIAHGATPQNNDLSGYDNVLLGEHFVTGDGRGNENIGLTAVHQIFHSEHNRLLNQIEETLNENPTLKAAYQDDSEADDWNYEQRLFQAARFANEMQYQHLVFEEFARTVQPAIDVVVLNENSYDSTINPAIVAEFAHVVYRFGHSMLNEEIERDLAGHPVDLADMPLLTGFLNPVAFHCASVPGPDNVCPEGDVLSSEEAAGAIVNGTTNQVANQIDELVTSTLRNNLLGLPLDLASINIMRGRDAGVPPLQAARKAFFAESGSTNLEPYTSWTDFGLSLKNGNNFGRGDSNAALVNFVAAYGKHPTILEATTLAGKRDAADLLVNGESTVDPLSRLWGQDAYGTAAAISSNAFPSGSSTVYIATGQKFQDALAAAPAAKRAGAPILLVQQNGIPAPTAQELLRLAPDRIVLLGGTASVSAGVEQTLRSYTTAGTAASGTRIWGQTAYDTAAAISAATFAPGAPVAYVATGQNFPDALAGGAVAARDGAPIVLVGQNSVTGGGASALTRLNPQRIVLLGGPNAVSENVLNQLRTYTSGSVTRIWGETAYDTAVEVSKNAYPSPAGADVVYLATGGNFPDALAVAPVAGARNGPVLLLPRNGTVPANVAAEIQRLNPERAVIVGGELAITPGQYDSVKALFTVEPAPADRQAFMNSTPDTQWANTARYDTVTGLEDVDFWVGGLAEALDPFGGMLGATFNYVFEEQLENLQFGDRFYYLFRNQGMQLFSALEANSFAGLIQRNTDASLVPADIFRVQEPSIDLENLPSPLPAGLVQLNGQWRWNGDEHIEIHGNRTEADNIRGGQGDDALWGYGGNDRIEGGSGNDNILGGAGDDILTDSFGADNIKGGWGNDYIDAGYGIDLVLGGHGDDFVVMGHDGPKDAFLGTGNDIAIGGTGRDNIRGGEGEDWIEGGNHADLLMGDNADQFQQDTWGGADVLIAGGGSDDYDAEGGDDIMVGQLGGTDRFHGMNGWDLVTYYGENRGVDADLTFNLLQPPDVTAIRDRFLRVEALSGGGGNDILRGVRATTDDALTEGNEENLLTEEGLARIVGLEDLLRPSAATVDYALRFMADPLLIDSDGTSNLLLGGAGSDVVEGRYGDDFLDGDAYLRVQLEANGVRYNNASQLQPLVLNGTVNPGDISIVREIAYDDQVDGVRDTAVYAQDFDHYVIAHLHDGYWQIRHNPETIDEIEESEGTDIIRNFEVLQFANGCWIIPPGATSPEQFEQCGIAGEISFTGQIDPPTEDMPLTATVTFDPAEVANPTDIRFNWQLGETGEEWEPSPTGDNLPNQPNGRVDTFIPGDADGGAILRVVVSFRDDDGNLRTIASEALPEVLAINDAPTQPTLNPATPRVGNGLIASGFTDADGLEEAAEAGITYTWQRAAAPAGPWSDIPGAQGTTPGYLVSPDDVGMVIRVHVSYTDDMGFPNEVYSVVSNPVQPAVAGLNANVVEGSLTTSSE